MLKESSGAADWGDECVERSMVFWSSCYGRYRRQPRTGPTVQTVLGKSLTDAHVNDNVDFETLDDVKLGDLVVIPKGSTAMATVTEAVPKRRTMKPYDSSAYELVFLHARCWRRRQALGRAAERRPLRQKGRSKGSVA